MKTIYSIILLLFFSALSIHAQFTVETYDGTPITDGSVFTFSGLGYTDAKLGFIITNTGSTTIDMRMEYISMTNANGSGENLCTLGTCYGPGAPAVGWIMPNPPSGGTSPASLFEPGESTPVDTDYFYNTDPGDGTNYPVEYVFKYYELNGNGDPITFTYRYDGTASVEDEAQVNFKLYPNVSDAIVNLKLVEKATAQLFNTQGQLIKQYTFDAGNHIIDVSSFSKQLYYLKLQDVNGHQSVAKIIVK